MTITEPTTPTAPLTPAAAPGSTTYDQVVMDLYRDIHKGIRAELFALTLAAGRTDPADRAGRAALGAHVDDVMALLIEHAHHEDGAIQPQLEQHLPAMADAIESDHAHLEGTIEVLRQQGAALVEIEPAEARGAVHRLYVELAAFTSRYLTHQDLEERRVMPALQDAIGVEAVVAVHGAIVGPMPPDQLVRSLAVMLPAMNVEDRTELLAGMRAGAPPEAFDQVWSLVGTVLAPADVQALAGRLAPV